jgi:hypothetical protein
MNYSIQIPICLSHYLYYQCNQAKDYVKINLFHKNLDILVLHPTFYFYNKESIL